jgi:aspartyl-tRNA synthetase
MSLMDAQSTLKRLRNRYRLVIMNDDTYEEVVTFKLTRLSVYVMMSSIFVLLTSLTVALIVFTPLKLYIPGYGEAIVTKELRQLKLRTDSLETAMKYKDQYLMNMKSVLQGDASVKLDTTMLAIPAPEHIDD